MSRDQAHGLRRLFARPSPFIVAITGAGATPLAIELAIALSELGRRVIVFDRTDDEVASACGQESGGEFADVLAGTMRWHEVALRGPAGITILPARQALDANEYDEHGFRDALTLASGEEDRPDDVWIINGPPPACIASATVLLPIAPTAPAMTGAYAEIKSLALTHGRRDFRIVLEGATSEAAALTVFKRVAETARHFLAARLTYSGCLPGRGPGRTTFGRSAGDGEGARHEALLDIARSIGAIAAPAASAH